MAMLACVAHVSGLKIPDADTESILGGHAAALLGVEA